MMIASPDSRWSDLISTWLALIDETVVPEAFVTDALRTMLDVAGADWGAIVVANAGNWQRVADFGRPQPLPYSLLADALDRESTVVHGSWLAAPLVERAVEGELLVLHVPAGADKLRDTATLAALALGRFIHLLRRQARESRDRRRLKAILDAAAQWYRIHEMQPLLEQMARAATQLVASDRASIFLWDKANHELVGRPALGVEGGELRIPDDAGIVGKVLQSGLARRVDGERDQTLIDRRVDRTLNYQTRTLLCVPLRSPTGEVLGVFEAINKLGGNFTDDDEVTLTEIAAHASIALANTQDRRQLLHARRQLSELAAERVQFIGQCSAIEALRSTIGRVAQTELAVLVLGENGTGKDVVAQSIHYLSQRRDQPLVAINCAAIPETLLESELFGHEKGAFTDARESRAGKFELAHGGTLFLDEIGDLSLGGQSKLLRVVEEKVIVRVGGSKTIPVDVRLIAATNQDLSELVRQKRFRQDLYYRLNVVSLMLPALRDRGSDIIVLAEHFLRDFSLRVRRTPPKFSAAAQRRLESHSWPGNVRELRNLMERIAYLVPGDTIDASDLPFMTNQSAEPLSTIPPDLHLSEATGLFQIEYIQQAMKHADGNMSRAAELLGLHRSNLYRKMKQLGMNTE